MNAVRNPNSLETYQTLSLFINVTDPDGVNDIETIYLINDNKELYWKLTSEEWEKKTTGGETWIGSNSLLMPDGSRFPGGEYRILVQDTGGDSDERTLAIASSPLNLSKLIFPGVIVKTGTITIKGVIKSYSLWTYSTSGRYINTFNLNKKTLKLNELTKGKPILSKGFDCYIYTYSSRSGYGLISGPYYVEALVSEHGNSGNRGNTEKGTAP